MFNNEHIPTIEETVAYFKAKGCNEQYAKKWWNRQQQFNWVSKFPYTEMADRWIAHATDDERLPPRTAWKPYGRTPAEKIASAQYAYSQLDEYPPDQQEDICAYLRQHASLQHAG